VKATLRNLKFLKVAFTALRPVHASWTRAAILRIVMPRSRIADGGSRTSTRWR
jgi:hypothetical protein